MDTVDLLMSRLTDRGVWWVLAGLVLKHPDTVRAELDSLLAIVEQNPDRKSDFFKED